MNISLCTGVADFLTVKKALGARVRFLWQLARKRVARSPRTLPMSLPMISELVRALAAGLQASILGVAAAARARAFYSPDLVSLVLHNGALFLGSVLVYERVLIPLVLREIPALAPSLPWTVLVLVWLVPLWL